MSFRYQWKYVNEGNVHVVLQILESNYVLRLIKEDDNQIKKDYVCESVEFVNLVMIPLIFCDRRYQEEVIEISSEELVQLTEKMFELRPKNRINKSILSTIAIKAPNLTMISLKTENFCIEIKPKEGFLANSLKKSSKCYYCLKQILKFKEKQIVHLSNYCPLDLFSGNKERMKFALRSLIESPQNNFKVFKNGALIYQETSQYKGFEDILKQLNFFSNSSNLFLDFIIEILLSDGKSDINVLESSKTANQIKAENCNKESNLENNSFLHNLLYLQKLSENFNSNVNLHDRDTNYVHSVLNEIKSQKLDLTNKSHRDIVFATWDPMRLALISAIVKDCSVMISFTNDTNNQFPKVLIGDSKLSYNLGVTDLEPKMAKVLLKRKHTEKKLLDIYAMIAKTPE
ncbi:unnamed protein product [Parnassius mnemosyne]|uniref:Inositol-pentakisphosphate 2-kinase n=1 Tax=Parnassius mnemosyne TaxID=213953 RepID=A0AAV1M4M6_9NEOP